MTVSVDYIGNIERAESLLDEAQILLTRLRTEMTPNNLTQLARNYPLDGGDFIRVQSFFGQDKIFIESPFEEVDVVEPLEVEELFIVRFRFTGLDGVRYYLFWDAREDELFILINDENGAEIEQPIPEEDLAKVSGVASGVFDRLRDMSRSEEAPGIDWVETSGGVPEFKKIRLFSLADYQTGEWLGGYTEFIQIDRVKNPTERIDGQNIYKEGDRTWVLGAIFPGPPDRYGNPTEFAQGTSYDFDLNGQDPGLVDYHTKEFYALNLPEGGVTIGSEEDLMDYYASHGKVIYALPNDPDNEVAFWGTKRVDYEVDIETSLGGRSVSGNIIGTIHSPIEGASSEVIYQNNVTRARYSGAVGGNIGTEFVLSEPREIPNFWLDNVSSASTDQGRAVIFEQYIIQKLYEWNGSPFNGPEERFDVTTSPTYDIKARIYVQFDVEETEDPDKADEAVYDYQMDNFVEINSEAIMEMIQSHPQYTPPSRLFAYINEI